MKRKGAIKRSSKIGISALENGNFELGTLLGWNTAGRVAIDTLSPHNGRYCARLFIHPGRTASLSQRFNLRDLNRSAASFIVTFSVRRSGSANGQLNVSFSNYRLGPRIIRFADLPASRYRTYSFIYRKANFTSTFTELIFEAVVGSGGGGSIVRIDSVSINS